jgi:hypothetical protein
MANFEFKMIEIVNYINNVNFFDGTLEKLYPFISSIDHLFKYAPEIYHQYILGVILNTKITEKVKYLLPTVTYSWLDLRTYLLRTLEATNFNKFYFHLARTQVEEFHNLKEFLEEMTNYFYKYNMALQYSEVAIQIDHITLIDNLAKQISRYVDPYILTLAVQANTYLEAIKVIQSKLIDKKAVESIQISTLKDFIKSEVQEEIKTLKYEMNHDINQSSCQYNYSGKNKMEQRFDNSYQNRHERRYNKNSQFNGINHYQNSNFNCNTKNYSNFLNGHSTGLTNVYKFIMAVFFLKLNIQKILNLSHITIYIINNKMLLMHNHNQTRLMNNSNLILFLTK